MDHDFFWLFNRYWWLLFPLAWAIFRMVRLSLEHARAQQRLELLKSYVDQGKEPPPEILKVLQPEAISNTDLRRYSEDWHRSGYIWVPVFLFSALACGFVFMAFSRTGDPENHTGLLFTAILMVGLALGFLVAALRQKKAADQDRLLPK